MELARKDTRHVRVKTKKKWHSYITSIFPATELIPVLLIHGAAGGAWYWEDMLSYITVNGGFPCFAPDITGHGERSSEHLRTRGVEDYVEDMVDFILNVIYPIFGCYPIIIGHSMGGLIAQKLAERGLANRVILIASAPPKGIELKQSALRGVTATDLLRGGFSAVSGLPFRPTEKLLRSLFVDPEKSKWAIERCKALRINESPRVIYQLLESKIAVDRTKITVPMLNIGTREDTIILPEVIEAIGEYYRPNGARTRFLENLGHLCPLEYGWKRLASTCLKWILAQQTASSPRT